MDKIIIILLSWSTVSLAWLRLADDLVDSLKVEISVDVQTSNRSKRSVKDKYQNPTSMDLTFQLEGALLKLHLERNDGVNTNLPIIVLENGYLRQNPLQDLEISTFYQDKEFGSTFAIQRTDGTKINMIGCFQGQFGWYTLQSKDTNSTSLDNGLRTFAIQKDKIVPIVNDMDIAQNRIDDWVASTYPYKGHRRRRADGSYNVELLMVADFSVYKYWYNLSQKLQQFDKEKDAYNSIRQYFAFIINGMDAAYKTIQTSAYTISVIFAGLVIAKTKPDSTWTESIKNTSTGRVSIESDDGLDNFRNWIRKKSSMLPEKDHSMLFTKYDLTRNGSSNTIGLAYVGTICGPSSQSLIEDQFDFQIITTTAHELGHSLSAEHDGKSNTCDENDGYVMAAVSRIHKGRTATYPWKFSSCSTNYFTTKINSLEMKNKNCLSRQGPKYDPTALAPYDKQLPGQIYDADEQCRHIHGRKSFFCRDRYHGNFTSICNGMWCSNPLRSTYCYNHIPGDGTQCGDKKWCVAGVCKYSDEAPSGIEQCLYGDMIGQTYAFGRRRTCQKMEPRDCQVVADKCCKSCEPIFALTNITDPDDFCKRMLGNGSYLCKGLYSGDYTTICETMWCQNPSDPEKCLSVKANEHTLCGSKKWCVSGICKSDIDAPAADEKCLYGDVIGKVFSNGLTCQQMYMTAPTDCQYVPNDCCKTCKPQLALKNITDPDELCKKMLGDSSYLCRGLYNENYSAICDKLWCSQPSNPGRCVSIKANDRTLCNSKKWCIAGICKYDVDAPFADSQCLYGDYVGPVYTSGETCVSAFKNNPYACYSLRKHCCQTCSPKTTKRLTTSTPQASTASRMTVDKKTNTSPTKTTSRTTARKLVTSIFLTKTTEKHTTSMYAASTSEKQESSTFQTTTILGTTIDKQTSNTSSDVKTTTRKQVTSTSPALTTPRTTARKPVTRTFPATTTLAKTTEKQSTRTYAASTTDKQTTSKSPVTTTFSTTEQQATSISPVTTTLRTTTEKQTATTYPDDTTDTTFRSTTMVEPTKLTTTTILTRIRTASTNFPTTEMTQRSATSTPTSPLLRAITDRRETNIFLATKLLFRSTTSLITSQISKTPQQEYTTTKELYTSPSTTLSTHLKTTGSPTFTDYLGDKLLLPIIAGAGSVVVFSLFIIIVCICCRKK